MRRDPNPARCGVCDRRCRDDGDAFACEQAHKNDPCWKCGVVHGHALGCVFASATEKSTAIPDFPILAVNPKSTQQEKQHGIEDHQGV